ncbi:MAG: hypothetical protein LBN34_07950 [Clostridiales Family XIII bacterium]|nr:hypothetical protein [Clostridiales Family XIII bacterium]
MSEINKENSKSIFRKWWFCLIVVLVVGGIAGGVGACGETENYGIKIPESAVDFQGKNYKDVNTELENAGFTNIELEPIEDLITGWVTNDGDVEDVSVNGKTDYTSGSKFAKDAKIVIRYHTFPAKEESEESEEVTNETSPEIADYIGKDAKAARDELVAQGYEVKLLHAVTGMDFTISVDYDDVPFIITDQDAPIGKSVTLYINTQEMIDEGNAKNSQAAKLGVSYAWGALSMYGDSQYPYGFKVHMITGMLAEEPFDDNTWFLKANCTVKNQYGTKLDAVVECKVTGTSDNPEVLDFIVY